MLTILTGLAAGTVHVVSGPDHLAALAPIAAHQPKQAVRDPLMRGRLYDQVLGLAEGVSAVT